jgi:hypothetical protein
MSNTFFFEYLFLLDFMIIESLKPSEKGEINKRKMNFYKSIEIAEVHNSAKMWVTQSNI